MRYRCVAMAAGRCMVEVGELCLVQQNEGHAVM